MSEARVIDLHADRLPPHNLDAEASVLGGLLLAGHNPEHFAELHAEVRATLSAEDFYRGAHRTVFEAVCAVHDRGEPVDPLTVGDELERQGRLESAGGAVGISELMSKVPSTASVAYYAGMVFEDAERRGLIDAGTRLTAGGYDQTAELEAVREDALERLSRSRSVGALVGRDELVEGMFDAHGRSGEPLGWGAPWVGLDRLWRIVPGWLHLVSGYPSSGKSALVEAAVVGLCEKHGLTAAIWSPEGAPVDEHAVRLASIKAGVDLSGRPAADLLEPGEWVADRVRFIRPDAVTTVPGILAQASQVHAKHGLDVLVIDPFTNVSKWDQDPGEGWDRMLERQLGRIQRWARTREVAVLVVVHPKGEPQHSNGTLPPSLKELHGGAVWRDMADSAVALWRDVSGERRRPEDVEVHVQKVRHDGRGGQMGRKGRLWREPHGGYRPVTTSAEPPTRTIGGHPAPPTKVGPHGVREPL